MTDEEQELAELRAQIEESVRQMRECAELFHQLDALIFPAPASEQN